MTIERFQGLILTLANQEFVRCYYFLNFPHLPQIMGIQFTKPIVATAKRKRSCECGACEKCKHREYMADYRPKRQDIRARGMLHRELTDMGFALRPDGIWSIERTEDEKEVTS